MYSVCRVTGSFDITNMINGSDVYNSNYIYLMDDLDPIGSYSTPYYKGRLDIIARCIYENEPIKYESIISVYNRLFLNNDTCMVDIKYPVYNDLRTLSFS